MSKLNSDAVREAIAMIKCKSDEKKPNMSQIQTEVQRQATTIIRDKSEEKKRDFGETVKLQMSEALREAITTIKKSMEKKHNF